MRVKRLAQEHNTMSPARARSGIARSGVERTNHEATTSPTGTKDSRTEGLVNRVLPATTLNVNGENSIEAIVQVDYRGSTQACAFQLNIPENELSNRTVYISC